MINFLPKLKSYKWIKDDATIVENKNWFFFVNFRPPLGSDLFYLISLVSMSV